MIKTIFTRFIVIFLHLFTLASFAQTATNDLTFNSTDVGFGQGDGPAGQVNAIAIQSDGKSIVGGLFPYYNWKDQHYIMRLDPNGDLDATFNIGTGFDNVVNAIAIQPDGKIVVGGGFLSYNGQSINSLARLNSDGTLDNTFTVGTGPNSNIRTIALQSDGKILIGGDFIYYNGVARNHIARLNSDGTLDATFSIGTGTDSWINSIVVQADNKVLIGGRFATFNGTSANGIARLNSDGSLDNTFLYGTGISAFSEVKAIAIQADLQILIGGSFTKYNGITAAGICRLNVDGTLDGTFTASASTVNTINIQSDNRIIIGGPFSSVNSTTVYAVARLETNGNLDTGFNPRVTGPASTVYALAIQGDGKMIAGGTLPTYGGLAKNRMWRLNSDSSLDTSFNQNTGANDEIYATTIQSDDKILIGGMFTLYNGTERYHIARLNADGTLDPTFDPGTGTNGPVYSIVVQPDGKILLGGAFSVFNGTARSCIVRLNADGSLDPTFNPGVGINGVYVRKILLQSDGKIILGGNFQQYNNAGYNGIVRITSTGGYDVSFSSGLSVTNTVESMVMQSDGKIVIGGNFTSYGGTARKNIARINSNGTLDTSFDPGQGTDQYVSSVVLQSDEKIIIGGSFTSYNGTAKNHVLRLNTDGSVDATFDSGIVSTLNIYSMLLQPDGKLLMTGYLINYNNTNIGCFLRLNSDGTLDANYVAPVGADGWTYALGLQSDGKIILGGGFMSFNATGRNRITRLLTTPCTPPTITSTTSATSCVASSVTVSATASSGTISWYSSSFVGSLLASGSSYTTPVLSSTNTYYVQANEPNCPSGRTAVTATINIPSVTGSTPASRCDAGTVLLKASANSGSTLDWYDASSGGSSLGTGTTFTTPSISATTTYYVEASKGGCVTASRTAVKATVNNTPIITTTKPGSVCGSGTAVLKASSDAGTLNWYAESAGGSSLGTGGTFTTPTISTTTPYYVDATSAGCVSERTSVEATVNTIPTITGTTPASRCGTGTVTLSATSDIGTIDWFTSSANGSSIGSGSSFTTPSITISTNYYAAAVNGSCASARTVVLATVNTLPVKTTSIMGSTITANETGAGYVWLDCNDGSSIIAGQSAQSYTPVTSGDYAVVISKNGCIDTSSCANVSITGITNSNSNNDFVISPNPGAGVFTIESAKSIQRLTVTNGTGAVILKQDVNAMSGKINLEGAANGIYYLHVNTNEGMQVVKLVVRK